MKACQGGSCGIKCSMAAALFCMYAAGGRVGTCLLKRGHVCLAVREEGRDFYKYGRFFLSVGPRGQLET